MPYRPQSEFLGAGAKKRLSAHTIASFMFLQGAPNVDDLTIDTAMSTRVLRELLGMRAVEYWSNVRSDRRGEPAWLATAESAMRLTSAGLNKVIQRAHGEDRTATGGRSPYNVSLQGIRLALDLIENGPRSTLGAGVPLVFIED
jgi:hypothetical protein